MKHETNLTSFITCMCTSDSYLSVYLNKTNTRSLKYIYGLSLHENIIVFIRIIWKFMTC